MYWTIAVCGITTVNRSWLRGVDLMHLSKDAAISNILKEITCDIVDLYGDKLRKIVLYGSYAKCLEDEESDIDLILLVDMNEPELRLYDKKLDAIAARIGYHYMKVLSIIDMNLDTFSDWADVVPFYRNVRDQGVVVYAQ